MLVYNVCIVELDERDFQRASTNGGLRIPLSPDTREVTLKGMAKVPKEPKNLDTAGE